MVASQWRNKIKNWCNAKLVKWVCINCLFLLPAGDDQLWGILKLLHSPSF